MIIFLTIYLLIGGIYLAYAFIKAEQIYQFNKDITDMLSDHDWSSVLCVVLLILMWLLLGVLCVTTWPIWMIGSDAMMLINKIRKN